MYTPESPINKRIDDKTIKDANETIIIANAVISITKKKKIWIFNLVVLVFEYVKLLRAIDTVESPYSLSLNWHQK